MYKLGSVIASCAICALCCTLLGCGSDDNDDGIPATDAAPTADAFEGTGTWYKPNAATTWQWQLVGSVNENYDVDVYDIDLYEVSAAQMLALQNAGKKVICYFSAGSYEPFRPDAGDFPPATLGNPIDGFEDENWLDIRDPRILDIMRKRLDLAVQKGCDGVEPDNVDGYQNGSGFPLSDEDQLNFNKQIANEAHMRDLSVGLKNDLDQVARLVDFFDFSVNEQCFEFDECEALLPFIQADKPVWNAEYQQQFVDNSAPLCQMAQSLNLRTLILPLDLDDSFRISCD